MFLTVLTAVGRIVEEHMRPWESRLRITSIPWKKSRSVPNCSVAVAASVEK